MAYSLSETEKKKKEYEAAKSNRPSEFQSKYNDIRLEMLDKIANREDFSYDPLTDEVYNIYKESYAAAGKKAMKEAAASAASLTGGFGSSYGARASADAYNDYLSRSGEILPELYEMALKRYSRNAENEDKLMALYNGLYSEEVDNYNDLWERYYRDLEAAEQALKLAEDSYNEQRNYYLKTVENSSSSSSKEESKGALKTETEAIRTFTAALLSRYSFAHSPLKNRYTSYLDYVMKTAQSWFYDGHLSERELAYIKNQYEV